MPLEPPDTFDNLRSSKDDVLIEQVNGQLREFKDSKTSGSDRALFLIRAQMLMQELARRDQDRQTRRMLDYTRAVTVMTGVITVMTLIQVWPNLAHLFAQLRGP
jgi:hypothetical protein